MGPREMMESFPDQLVWEDLGEDLGRFSKVLLCGMGGSGIVGDIVRSWADRKGLKVPVVPHRGYSLPPWAEGKDTLVVCISYSGNTEETLSNFETALERGCVVVTVSSGGKLKEMAESRGIRHLTVPKGYAPRYALGFMLSKVLCLMGAGREELEEAKENLKGRIRDIEERGEDLARRVYGYVPLLYATPLTEAVAFRWKTQVNENAKTQAYFVTLPELHHNEVVGLDNAELRSRFHFLILSDPEDHPRVRLRVDITADLLKDLGVVPMRLNGEGSSYLARVLYLIYVGDWMSYHLALRYGFDPLPVRAIDTIKKKLSEIK
jgi:glucose/mannose-6-phosphate isomerase